MKRHLKHIYAGLTLLGILAIWVVLGCTVSLLFFAVPVVLALAKFIGFLLLDVAGSRK